jgi:hypothetical protein
LTNLSSLTIGNQLIGIERYVEVEVVVDHYLQSFARQTVSSVFVNRLCFDVSRGTISIPVDFAPSDQFNQKFRGKPFMEWLRDIAQCILKRNFGLFAREPETTIRCPPYTFNELGWLR